MVESPPHFFSLATILLLITIVTVSGCAPAPAEIMAEPVSKVPYLDLTCDELDIELQLTQAKLEVAEEKQRSARRKSIGANLLLLGAGSLVDGPQKEVAVLKGTVITLTELIEIKCVVPKPLQSTSEQIAVGTRIAPISANLFTINNYCSFP